MATSLTNQSTTTVVRPLSVLVPLIKKDLQEGNDAAERARAPYYQAAGEKMLEAKVQFEQMSEFYKWVKRNFDLGETQAKVCIRAARTTFDTEIGTTVPPPTISEFKRSQGWNIPTSGAVRREYQPPIDKVLDRVDMETLSIRREELKRTEERDAQRKLALQLIDIGYKALASKLHPDKGGSRDAMARLNQVRERLKGCA